MLEIGAFVAKTSVFARKTVVGTETMVPAAHLANDDFTQILIGASQLIFWDSLTGHWTLVIEATMFVNPRLSGNCHHFLMDSDVSLAKRSIAFCGSQATASTFPPHTT